MDKKLWKRQSFLKFPLSGLNTDILISTSFQETLSRIEDAVLPRWSGLFTDVFQAVLGTSSQETLSRIEDFSPKNKPKFYVINIINC